jgi:GTP-binding protein
VPTVRPEEKSFTVTREKDHFRISGKKIERIVLMTDLAEDDAVARLQNRLKKMGLEDALTAAGAKEGDTAIIKDFEFNFIPDPEMPGHRRRRKPR